MNRNGHHEKCLQRSPHLTNPHNCDYCTLIRDTESRAYRAGFNDHAASAAHWEATHGAYKQHGDGENP